MIELITGVQSARLGGININDDPVSFVTVLVDTSVYDHPEVLRYVLDNNGLIYDADAVEEAFINPGKHELEISSPSPTLDLGHVYGLNEVLDWKGGEHYIFRECYDLIKVPDYLPSTVRSTHDMFSYCSSFNSDISQWDTSNVADMSRMFNGAAAFNSDISQWDTSNVTDMSWMFNYAKAFNGDISQWDVGNVTDMSVMFWGADAFNSDISQWDVSNVTDMSYMFYGAGAEAFNQDLSMWCVTRIPSQPIDFYNINGRWVLPKPVWGTCPAVSFATVLVDTSIYGYPEDLRYELDYNELIYDVDAVEVAITNPGIYELEISSFSHTLKLEWISGLTEVLDWKGGEHYIFEGCHDLIKVPNYLPSTVRSTSDMFSTASSFNSDISQWDVSNVTGMSRMFYGANAFNGDISHWDVSNVTDMSHMFRHASSFNGDISQWDTSNVTDMSYMFYGAEVFNSDISQWDTSNVTDMYSMFWGAYAFNGDISQWDVSNVTNMENMFWGAEAFNQDLSMWCVTRIPTEPWSFYGSWGEWTLPKPVWGTCP